MMQDPYHEKNQDILEKAFLEIIQTSGENPQRQGLLKTPKRAAKAFLDLTSGYHVDIDDLINDALFETRNDAMVIVRNIEFHSLCEHHLLPFSGKVDVGYLPNKKVLGLSKIPRIIDVFAKRLQIQEQLCHEVASCIENATQARGVGVVIHAQHTCMSMRGIEKQCASMTTSAMLGAFRDSEKTRSEFLMMVNR